MAKSSSQKLNSTETKELLQLLQKRFESHPERHKGIKWETVLSKLESAPNKLWSLYAMESTGGEPDVVLLDKKSGNITFFDCSAESPKERRSWCYDHEALASRKQHKPENSAIQAAEDMGTQLLTVDEYQYLQTLGNFDLKTSSWLATPEKIRKLGGALFGDKRYDTVFIYHNGAESYYGARGYRASLIV